MSRKTDPALLEAIEDYKSLALIRYEFARDLYNYQDATTRKAIDVMRDTVALHTNGLVNLDGFPPTKVDDETIKMNVFWLVTQAAADMAFVGIRVGNFKFNPKTCCSCGDPVKPAKGK